MASRKEIINHLKYNAEKKSFRGKVLWVVKNEKIYAYEIFKDAEDWDYSTYEEKDGFPFLHCPKNYLDITPIVDIEWRSKVREYHDGRLKKINEIRTLFSDIQHSCKICDHTFKMSGHEDDWICPKCKSDEIESEKEIYLKLGTKRKGYYLPIDEVLVTKTFPFIHGRNLETYKLYKIQPHFIEDIIVKEKK